MLPKLLWIAALLAALAACTGVGTPSAPSAVPLGRPPTAAPAASFLPDAPDRDLYRLAAELSPGAAEVIGRAGNQGPFPYREGQQDAFWLVDFQELGVYQRQFQLRLVSARAYWYVEDGLEVGQGDLEQAAATFEAELYPRVTEAFGRELSPGVDHDPQLHILHARLRGVAGYVSGSDAYPRTVYRYSNQRETIYINASAVAVGSPSYLEVLAHELQHAIHGKGDPSEDTWVNEGLSELAVSLAGYRPASIGRFLQTPTTSLVHWPVQQPSASANYGAAALFMHYLWEHYGRRGDLRLLVAQPADSIAGVDAYLKALGYTAGFREVFRDWVAANLLDESQGVYGYADLAVQVRTQKSVSAYGELVSELPQFAAEYLELTSFRGPLRLRFRGPRENTLLPIEVAEGGCWWSNSGDSINSTLTRRVDLTGLARATLSYQVWYSLEEGWDYAYLEVSVDGGRTWEILGTPHTSPENPIGNSFGPGYTGASRGWLSERVDLTPYAGREILLRFQYVTDDAINGHGLCLQRIAVPEAGLGDDSQGWRAEGFIRTDNRVRQEYIVQVIQVGRENRVTVMALDEANSGEVLIRRPEELKRLVVAVAALAPKTRQPAPYTLIFGPANP